MQAVSIRNVQKQYGKVPVLKALNLDIAAGDFTVLLGASGCGKSTLLSIIAGLEDPTEGRVMIGERDVTLLPPKARNIAMVFQSYALYPTMTVEQNMSFGLRMAGQPKAEIGRRLQWAAELLQLGPYMARKPADLSGGQRQRVAIGRAIVREADIYLFDEPLSNLDAKLRAEMRMEIRKLHQRLGATMVYVTHDQVEAMTMATRIAVMRHGVVEQYDTPKAIYDQPQTLYVAGFIGSPGMNFLHGRLQQDAAGPQIVVGGQAISLNGYGFRQAPAAPLDAVLGVRPEDLSLAGTGQALLKGVAVESCELLGADTIVWLQAGEQRLALRCSPAQAPEAGSRVDLHFEVARASVFDRATEQRL